MTPPSTPAPRQVEEITNDCGITLPSMVRGTLIKRYKRFLADVRLPDGQTVTVHCANSGRMTTCADPGRTVYISPQNRPGRKYPWSWELIEMPDSLVGINTLLPNRLVAASVLADGIAELAGYTEVQREVRVGAHTRLDLVLAASGRRDCYVEVKNCTWVVDAVARFPDAPTARGQKHLGVLSDLVAAGHRAVMFYVVQRMDAHMFEPAADVDPAYARELAAALKNGVELVVYDTRVSTTAIQLGSPLAWRL